MGHITTEYINTLSDEIPHIFIETGTFKGGIPQRMIEDGTITQFQKVYTIELNPEMCKIASKRYSLFEAGETFDTNTDEKDESFKDRKEFFDGKLVLIQGDSSKKLKEVLDEVDGEPCVFWLDAHAGAKEGYVSGEVDCPLIQELEVIKNYSNKKHIIAIDDADSLGNQQMKDGKVVCDYSHIKTGDVKKLLRDINKNFKIDYPSPFGQLMVTAVDNNTEVVGSNWWGSE